MHALAGIERQIRATDPNSRRKYLVDFSEAFRSYDAVLPLERFSEWLSEADILLVGDYHALPASQEFAAKLLQRLRESSESREIVVGLETIFSRDQHILEEWQQGEIDEAELRERIRFDLDWGYQWEPFYALLNSARKYAKAIYGLDCMPRQDLRKIGARDRHAAVKIAEMREQHPEALIVVLFGESHLAPNHLPRLLYERLRTDRVLTVLQNVDALYWRAAGESQDRVEAVQVSEDVACVFNATPLEKYESYRLCLDRWSCDGGGNPDLGPTIYNLIGGLVRFLGMNAYSPHNTSQPKFLVDSLPEVHSRNSDTALRKLLARKAMSDGTRKLLLRRLEETGSIYLPQANAFYIRGFEMTHASEEAARFLHHACRGLPECAGTGGIATGSDLFYTRTLEHALGYFGSRVLCPERAPLREAELYALYEQTRGDVEQQTSFEFPDFIEMLDFLALHRGFELNPSRYADVPTQIKEGVEWEREKLEYVTRQLGYMLGSDIYDAYLEGRISRRVLKSFFLRHLEEPGTARETYFALVSKVRPEKKRPQKVRQ